MKTKYISLLFITPLLFCACNKKENKKFEYDVYKDLSYGEYGERNLYDVAFPKGINETSLVFYIHGGGWSAYDKGNAAEDNALNYDDGYIYAGLNYRYASYTSDCANILEDITKCLNKIKENAEERNVTIKKVSFYGHSAGAHLSLFYAYKMKDVCPFEIGFVASYSGVFDLTDPALYELVENMNTYDCWWTWLTGKTINTDNMDAVRDDLLQVSPINYVNNACPTLIFHGEQDQIFPYATTNKFVNALAANNIIYERVKYENSGHGLENDKNANEQEKKLVKQYKEQYL